MSAIEKLIRKRDAIKEELRKVQDALNEERERDRLSKVKPKPPNRRKRSDITVDAVIQTLSDLNGNMSATARQLGCSVTIVEKRLAQMKKNVTRKPYEEFWAEVERLITPPSAFIDRLMDQQQPDPDPAQSP